MKNNKLEKSNKIMEVLSLYKKGTIQYTEIEPRLRKIGCNKWEIQEWMQSVP